MDNHKQLSLQSSIILNTNKGYLVQKNRFASVNCNTEFDLFIKQLTQYVQTLCTEDVMKNKVTEKIVNGVKDIVKRQVTLMLI